MCGFTAVPVLYSAKFDGHDIPTTTNTVVTLIHIKPIKVIASTLQKLQFELVAQFRRDKINRKINLNFMIILTRLSLMAEGRGRFNLRNRQHHTDKPNFLIKKEPSRALPLLDYFQVSSSQSVKRLLSSALATTKILSVFVARFHLQKLDPSPFSVSSHVS